MLDYSQKIPAEYWNVTKAAGALVDDSYKGKALCIYVPAGYDPQKEYDVFYFKMGTNNTARQFWTYPGYTSHFERVIDNIIERGEIRPCIIVAIQGNPPGKSWLPENAYGLVCYVEGKYRSYAKGNADLIIDSAKHRAVGGWSLGAIECRTILVNDKRNDFWKMYGWYDIQSGYNSSGMGTISRLPFVGCAAGSNDDIGCIKFTGDCAKLFIGTQNKAQIVPGYSHMIKFQLNYFYNAVKYFFGIENASI